MILAWLLLLTGLTISAVAIYYSVIGLAAIFAAATIPIYIMGGSLEVAKLVCASWLKANWDRCPGFMKTYMTLSVIVLMFITSMGIFGFLSKAHTDQSLVSGDVLSKIAVYDEKIKTEKENIDVARKTLKQLDEAVDQVMARSADERGADKAAQIRRSQQRERSQLQRDIVNAQSNIAKLQTERAPIAAEVRKVEAEVGPIKYIAKLIYGDNPDTNILEKAVTWVIILIVIVFDPLAVIMLLAAQMTFQWYREQRQEESYKPDAWVADVGERPTKEELVSQEEKDALRNAFSEPAPHHPDTHPYLRTGFKYPEGWGRVPPLVGKPAEGDSPQVDANIASQATVTDKEDEAFKNIEKKVDIIHKIRNTEVSEEKQPETPMPLEQWNAMIAEAEKAVAQEKPEEDFPKKKINYMIKEDYQQIKKQKE